MIKQNEIKIDGVIYNIDEFRHVHQEERIL